ncbi:MAG TPA: hypothetical protein VK254_01330 [Candidatus Bathyarchaeia archaeon]|nr:hypothetical protein [Candidatus Bathyarchaeia archaeon]
MQKEKPKVKDVRLSCGSSSDRKFANLMIPIFQYCGVTYGVSDLSCHRHAGKGGFDKQVRGYKESVVAVIGGHALHKVGAIKALYQSDGRWQQIVLGVPIDGTARDSIEGLPFGVFPLTAGYNREHPESSIKNHALAVVQLIGLRRPEVLAKLNDYWQKEIVDAKPRQPEVSLDEKGLAVLPQKK